jgi:toxin ParE1/3/4
LKLVWTKAAKDDLSEIALWIAEDNPAAALHHIRKIRRSVARLEHYPQLGRTGRIDTTREWVIPGAAFVVAYRLRGSRIEVLAVIHAARSWPGNLP